MIDVLEVLAWPATVIVVIAILRQPLAVLVQTTQQLKYKDLEVKFRESIERIEAESNERDDGDSPPDPTLRNVPVDLYDLAKVSPTAAVIESWKSVEVSARELISSKGHRIDYDVPMPYKLIQNVLVRGNIIDEHYGKMFNELRQLRNKVVHATGYSLDEESALQYIAVSLRLRNHLKKKTVT